MRVQELRTGRYGSVPGTMVDERGWLRAGAFTFAPEDGGKGMKITSAEVIRVEVSPWLGGRFWHPESSIPLHSIRRATPADIARANAAMSLQFTPHVGRRVTVRGGRALPSGECVDGSGALAGIAYARDARGAIYIEVAVRGAEPLTAYDKTAIEWR